MLTLIPKYGISRSISYYGIKVVIMITIEMVTVMMVVVVRK